MARIMYVMYVCICSVNEETILNSKMATTLARKLLLTSSHTILTNSNLLRHIRAVI